MSVGGGKIFKRLKGADEALRAFLSSVPIAPLDAEEVPIGNCLNRVLARDIVAPRDLPDFNRAAMDGYAVISADVLGASQTNPALLRVVGKAEAGSQPHLRISDGEAVAVATGAPLPEGADAVVMVEHTRAISDSEIEVYSPVTPGENVQAAGEDVKAGEAILKRGTKLRPWDIGMLAALGIGSVEVIRRPKVAIISTGDELAEPGEEPRPGSIINSSRFILSAMVEELGALPVYLGIAKDSLEEIRAKIEEGLRTCDVVLITGGTSVGEKDLVPEAINSLGKPGMLIHGVAIRPGMPTGLAAVYGKPIISLSGYAVAAMMGFMALARPLILMLLGSKADPAPRIRAKMARRVASPAGMRTFLRVLVEGNGRGGYVAEPIRSSGSGILSSVVKANGLVVIPEWKEGIEEGEEVEVELLRPLD
ncbi:MAG: molybdopterin molybdotransferase MoeA [Candidatus Bathyarchaeia archaeon]